MKTWKQLLDRDDFQVRQDCGPHTNKLIAAVIALQDAEWYAKLGQSSPIDDRAIRVRSWSEALSVLDDSERYVVGGTLVGPWDEMHRCDQLHPELHDWWICGRKALSPVEDVRFPEVPGLSHERAVLLTDYMFDYFNLLMMEIVYSDVSSCVYFREQLQWFHAGHFPCGWEGEWPVGKMRVY
jgi:hypothetical protein